VIAAEIGGSARIVDRCTYFGAGFASKKTSISAQNLENKRLEFGTNIVVTVDVLSC
jgi:hypothetical protein